MAFCATPVWIDAYQARSMLRLPDVEHAAQALILARLGRRALDHRVAGQRVGERPAQPAVALGGDAADRRHVAQGQADRDGRVEQRAGQEDQTHQRPVPEHQRDRAQR